VNFPADLHSLVDQLAIASKKLANIEEEAAKLPRAQEEVQILRDRLLTILDKHGFAEDAVDLLLAAR
jgi:hypothetical protein